MKRLVFTALFAIAALNTFAWHKAELYYSNGTVSMAEIKLPSETFSGIFNRDLVIKDGDNENTLNVKEISKVVLSNGITFIKYDNKGNPILLEQVTQYYNGVNLLVLPTVYSPEFIEASRYMYRIAGNATFEEQPVSFGMAHTNRDINSGLINNPAINAYDYNPLGVYYSSITRNGHLYTPASNDYIYLMKGDQIERLQSVHTYGTLSKFMGDNEKINAYIKKGLSSFYELNSLIAVYNAQAIAGN